MQRGMIYRSGCADGLAGPCGALRGLAGPCGSSEAFLQKKYGNLIRAWRQALSQTDSMAPWTPWTPWAVGICDLLRFGAALGPLLSDGDGGSMVGQASIDELDPKNAEILAQFKEPRKRRADGWLVGAVNVWVTQKFGGVRAAFEAPSWETRLPSIIGGLSAIDSDSTRFINSVEFANALKKFEFSRPSKQRLGRVGSGGWGWGGQTRLFNHFDKDGDGKIAT
eukprot:Skav232548  [mRNA]  locus=scaffold7124:34472:37761:+ [translate_table: standard]